jgi:hypothetical protein
MVVVVVVGNRRDEQEQDLAIITVVVVVEERRVLNQPEPGCCSRQKNKTAKRKCPDQWSSSQRPLHEF